MTLHITSLAMASDPSEPSPSAATGAHPRHTDLIFPSAEQHASMSALLGTLKRSTLSVHNRLASIRADAQFVARAAAALSTTTTTTPTTTATTATTSTATETITGDTTTDAAETVTGPTTTPAATSAADGDGDDATKSDAGKRAQKRRTRARVRTRRPLVANERCGSWYVPPGDKAASAYFKSTDGHERAWKFSTRRLNLHLVELIEKNDGPALRCSAVHIHDMTHTYPRVHRAHHADTPPPGMPDALSTTVPVWCAVLNRVLLPDHPLSSHLHLPPHLLPSTRAQVTALLPGFADALRALHLGPALPTCLTKPLRPLWVTQDSPLRFRDLDDGDGAGLGGGGGERDERGRGEEEEAEEDDDGEEEEDDDDGTLFEDYRPVICLTASRRVVGGTEADAGGYIQGAADDTENWAHGLTPSLFWENTDALLSAPEESLPDLIASLLASASAAATSSEGGTTAHTNTHRLTPHISPPAAANDAATASAEGQTDSQTTCHIALTNAPTPKEAWVKSTTYMEVGLGKNKTAARNLRLALPEICSFAAKFLEKGATRDSDGGNVPAPESDSQQPRPQIVVGCDSGRDVSVGTALALSCYLFDDEGRFRVPAEGASFTKTLVKIKLGSIMTAYPEGNPSRQTLQSVNSFLMDWRN
ncbi:2'-O-ribosyl phosphate transferase RIT1 [Purpureocillium lavendulum]|uniref:2'-O-ribosyl phosphate transferase RIT1 n=1 Tax=Purpureocillium lavendulum TaxID=1247861 RepID=A0AB34FH54_9HYPO|nr:2'-O-ribosyl phosphate transferase RIT1 [Purpureocillium lavendulum]